MALVTFTDGSDMYIHLEVLYIAVMLGIVQKEENKSCQRCLKILVYGLDQGLGRTLPILM